MKYTVLLLRPDWIANGTAPDTFQAWVEAHDPAHAEELARLEAVAADGGPNNAPAPYEYDALAMYEGHLNDICPGAYPRQMPQSI